MPKRSSGTTSGTATAPKPPIESFEIVEIHRSKILAAPYNPRVMADAARSMDLKYSNDNGQLRLLVYNIGKNKIESGDNTIIEIPYSGDGVVTVDRADAADYDGQPYVTASLAASVPTSYALNQNYPNPFNPTTKISFSLPTATGWSLKVYNVSGSLVKEFTGDGAAGNYEVEWDGRSQNGTQTASGVYFYRLEAGSFSRTMKMILLK